MNIYLVTQNSNNGYDTYDSFVCAAPDEETARRMWPNSDSDLCWSEDGQPLEMCYLMGKPTGVFERVVYGTTWATHLGSVTATKIGTSDDNEQRIILASFKAG